MPTPLTLVTLGITLLFIIWLVIGIVCLAIAMRSYFLNKKDFEGWLYGSIAILSLLGANLFILSNELQKNLSKTTSSQQIEK